MCLSCAFQRSPRLSIKDLTPTAAETPDTASPQVAPQSPETIMKRTLSSPHPDVLMSALADPELMPKHGCTSEDARAVALLLSVGNLRDKYGNYLPYEKIDKADWYKFGIPESFATCDSEEIRKSAQRWLLGNLRYLTALDSVATSPARTKAASVPPLPAATVGVLKSSTIIFCRVPDRPSSCPYGTNVK